MYIISPVFYTLFVVHYADKLRDIYRESKKIKVVASFLKYAMFILTAIVVIIVLKTHGNQKVIV